MLDLDTRVDLDEVVAAHLVNQEFSSTGVAITHALGQLDSVGQNGLANLLREVRGGCDLDNFLMTTLDRAIALEEVDCVARTISQKLDFDVAGALEEPFDEDSTIAESRLGLADCTLEVVLEVGLFANDTHTTASSAHSSLDDHWIRPLGLNYSTVYVW